jgi:hypothetical protein
VITNCPDSQKMNNTNAPEKIDFLCQQLSITDDQAFGCTIEFSDSIDDGNESIEDIIIKQQRNTY